MAKVTIQQSARGNGSSFNGCRLSNNGDTQHRDPITSYLRSLPQTCTALHHHDGHAHNPTPICLAHAVCSYSTAAAIHRLGCHSCCKPFQFSVPALNHAALALGAVQRMNGAVTKRCVSSAPTSATCQKATPAQTRRSCHTFVVSSTIFMAAASRRPMSPSYR